MGNHIQPEHGSLIRCLEQAEHRLRTPLTSIRTISDILVRYPVATPEAQRRFHQILHEEAVRLSDTVDELFTVYYEEGREVTSQPEEPLALCPAPPTLVAAAHPRSHRSPAVAWASSHQPVGKGEEPMKYKVHRV